MYTHVLQLIVLVESSSHNRPSLNIFFFINNCIYRRCHWRLRKTLIFKSLLLVYSLLKLSLLTYRPTDLLLILLLLLLLPAIIPLYCRTSVHALFVRYTRLPLVITTRLVYISYLLSVCYVDSYDTIIIHLSQLLAVSVSK